MISELITFRTTKAKINVKFGVRHLSKDHVSQLISIRKRSENIFGGETNFTLVCVATVLLTSSFTGVIWGAIDGVIILVNALKKDLSINSLGMVASFSASEVLFL